MCPIFNGCGYTDVMQEEEEEEESYKYNFDQRYITVL
jgi:hypothetical protein